MSTPSRRGRPRSIIPSYRLHKASGQAVVTIRGQTHYLGRFDSPESRRKYGELLVVLASESSSLPPVGQAAKDEDGISIAELCVDYLSYAETHYVKNGRQTDEVDCYKSLMRILKKAHGFTPLRDFGPNCLRAVREEMIELGWTRGYINRQVNRLRHMVKWAVGRDLVVPSLLERLQAVEYLLVGRSRAKEGRPRRKVSDAEIEAVKAKIRSQKAKDLIDLQLLTAARPGELLAMTTETLDRSQAVWTFDLKEHKTEGFGKQRTLVFGPKSQSILGRYLRPDAPKDRLFQIALNTYEGIVRGACDRAQVSRFVPHELRHTGGSRYHDELGFEAARAMLGHSQPSMTAHYTDHLHDKAVASAAVLG